MIFSSVAEAVAYDTLRARQFAQEVRDISKKYNLPFFFVTDGASATSNNGNDAIRTARLNHEEWEKKNNVDPKHDWSDNINKK
jgi:pyruvate/2-oxoacid:ferredoxin oxidoreductase alpha subunit